MDSFQDEFGKVIEEIGEVEYTGLGSVEDLLRLAVRCRASDLHLTAGTPPVLRIDGRLWRLPELARKGSEMARKQVKGLLAVWPEMGAPLDPKTVEVVIRKAFKEGVGVKAVWPAHASTVGYWKYMQRYGIICTMRRHW